MQKSSPYKAFLLFTLLFVLIAICSFVLFGRAEPPVEEAPCCIHMTSASAKGELLWELLSKKFLTFVSI
jgi:hypothetical protein